MRVSLTLKGLTAILLVCCVQLGLIFSILNNLSEAEAEAAREARAKEIVGRTSQFIKRFYETGSNVKGYFESRDEKSNRQYEEALNTVRSDIKWLKNAMKENPQSAEAMKKIDDRCNKILDMLNEAKRAADGGRLAAVYPRIKKFRENLQPTFIALISDVDNLIASQKVIVEESPKLQAQSREEARKVLYFGIFANILMAIFLALFFLGDIRRRVHVVIDNTKRLADDQELNKKVSGHDEIATLDSAFHDMSSRLNEARQRELAMIESMPVGLILADADGGIDFVNSTGTNIFGHDKEAIGELLLTDLFEHKAEDPSSFVDELSEFKDGKVGDLKVKTMDGVLKPVEVSVEPFETVDGSRILVVVLDVTERYELQELRKSFVSMVSHELRTPLGSVQNFLGLLNMGVLGEVPEKTSKLATSAERSVNRLIGLINELLDLEKMEQGELPLDITQTNLDNVIEILKESVDGFASKHEVKLLYPSKEIEFEADENKVGQVLINLVSNAVKFSQKGKKVEIDCVQENGSLKFMVLDQGRGIPKEKLELVFEKFQQVKSSDNTVKRGSGLGLAICKTIVESHGGFIGVDSEEGKGSNFWFTIPVSATDRNV